MDGKAGKINLYHANGIDVTMMVFYHNYRLHLKNIKNKSQKQDKENIFNDFINQYIPLNTYV